VPPDDDPSMPLFFLSYARAKGPQPDPNGQVVKLFNDLSGNVAELVSRMAGAEPGFMDRSMQGGGRWSDEVLQAVGGCQVFVALLSAPYMSSEWCGMEWYAFSQRVVTKLRKSASSHQTCIIPVAWAPVPDERVPDCVLAVQRFLPAGLPNAGTAWLYENEGVLGLLKLSLDASYQAVVWRLAQRIAEICYSHKVEPRIFNSTELRNIFQEQAGD
jgi:TIR domain